MDKNIKKYKKSGAYHRTLQSTKAKYKLMLENLKSNQITHQESNNDNAVGSHPLCGMSNLMILFCLFL